MKHNTTYASGNPDFTVSDALVTIDTSVIVDIMREECGEADSSIDINTGATVKLTLADGSCLSHNVDIGE